MSATEARDDHGRWTAGSGSAEQAHRDAGKYPVTDHAGVHSVGSHTGFAVRDKFGRVLSDRREPINAPFGTFARERRSAQR